MLAFLPWKLVTEYLVLRQIFVKGLLINVGRRGVLEFYNSFGLPMFSVDIVLKNSFFLFY